MMKKKLSTLVETLAGDDLRAARACGVSKQLSARFSLACRVMQIATICMLAIAIAMFLRASAGSISFQTDWGQFVSPAVCAGFLWMLSALFGEISKGATYAK